MDGLIRENPKIDWMITRGTPICGHFSIMFLAQFWCKFSLGISEKMSGVLTCTFVFCQFVAHRSLFSSLNMFDDSYRFSMSSPDVQNVVDTRQVNDLRVLTTVKVAIWSISANGRLPKGIR